MSLPVPSLEDVRRLRRAEYDQLVAQGCFDGEQVELLEGFVVRMSPHGPLHDNVISALLTSLVLAVGDRAIVRGQSSFVASDGSEPEPDIAVVPEGDYTNAHPSTALLVVEVAETSLSRDLGAKGRIYAHANVPEYWVIDLKRQAVHVHREPRTDAYQSIEIVEGDAVLSPVSFADIEFIARHIVRGVTQRPR